MGNNKTLRKKLTFEQWFKAQHGERPSDKEIYELEREAFNAQFFASQAKATLEATKNWEAQRTSALYAWQIAK